MRCAGLPSRSGLGGDRNHGGADMAQAKTWVAFDVHTTGVVAAVLERESGELRVQRLPAGSEAAVAFAAGLAGPVRATYEAGPTGFVLARKLAAAGIECVVCAPGLIPRGPSPIVETPSASCGCWPLRSCMRSRSRAWRPRRCVTSCVPGRICA